MRRDKLCRWKSRGRLGAHEPAEAAKKRIARLKTWPLRFARP
jgi:hypothetical protein